ncbi:hypothetical protein [Pseudomonas sp. S1(2024)]|uniref:hypothetical protein n=1 Tax=Pseudomonas sp. S1(2024) TaxID=3390191 RepID=UPI00397AABE8
MTLSIHPGDRRATQKPKYRVVADYQILIDQAVRRVLAAPPFSMSSAQRKPLRELIDVALHPSNLSRDSFWNHLAKDLRDTLDPYLHETPVEQMRLWEGLSKCGLEPIAFFENTNPSITGSMVPSPRLQLPEHDEDKHTAFRHFKDEIRHLDQAMETFLFPEENAIQVGSKTFASHEARLYHLINATPANATYLATSKLMARCRGWWLDELQQPTAPRVFNARTAFYHSLIQCPSQHEFAPTLEALHNYFLSMSIAFAGMPAQEDPEAFDWEWVEMKTHSIRDLQFDEEQAVTLAATALIAGSIKGAARILETLIDQPDAFVQALRAGGQNNEQAQYFLKVCLYSHLNNSTISPSEVLSLVENMRTAFVGYGYHDIVRTQALDAVTCHLDAAEQFETMGYLRTEPMGMGDGFCRTPHKVKNKLAPAGTREVEPQHCERAMALALRLQQTEMIERAATVFFDFEIDTAEESMLCHGAALRFLIDSDQFDPTTIITTPRRAEMALKLGVSREKFLAHPQLKHYAASALEIDLGL